MSTIKLDTSNDIVTFLRILAEESVKDARESLASDPKQEYFVKNMNRDDKFFNTLSEQPEEEDVEVEEEETDVEEPPATLEVSLDSISDTIKQLRSGRSVDDSKVRDQLRTYFDRLDETERQALLTFLRAFSGILTGSLQGDSAPDPSDPPSSITMSAGDDEEVEEPAEDEEEIEGEVEETPEGEEEEEEEEEEGGEDTTPPIKAGEPAELAEIRKRVRTLMRK
jgi:hypothetical protein